MNLNFISVADFEYSLLVQEHRFVFFLVIITLALAVILRTSTIFISQLALLFAFFILNAYTFPVTYYALFSVQLLLSIITIYKLIKAIDRNYILILEKTHKASPHLTKGNNGSQKSFF